MKLVSTLAIVFTSLGALAQADSRIERLCGAGHVNEAASSVDIRSNPDGYYVASLKEQVSQGDPRIILTNTSGFHLCTASTAHPGMVANDVYRLHGSRKVKFLFVPYADSGNRPSS